MGGPLKSIFKEGMEWAYWRSCVSFYPFYFVCFSLICLPLHIPMSRTGSGRCQTEPPGGLFSKWMKSTYWRILSFPLSHLYISLIILFAFLLVDSSSTVTLLLTVWNFQESHRKTAHIYIPYAYRRYLIKNVTGHITISVNGKPTCSWWKDYIYYKFPVISKLVCKSNWFPS